MSLHVGVTGCHCDVTVITLGDTRCHYDVTMMPVAIGNVHMCAWMIEKPVCICIKVLGREVNLHSLQLLL